MRKHQILIVGGGIGGSSAAFHMAKAGLDVLMIEKDQFPRDKPCGDGVVQSIHPVLKSMGILDDYMNLGYICKGTYFSDPREEAFTYHYKEGEFAIAMPRLIGDAIVNKAARDTGIDYLENFEATEVLTERGQAVGIRGIHNGKVVEIEADLVVLANGAHSMLSRQVGFYEEDPNYVFYGMRGYFEGVRGLTDVIEFHYPHEMFMPAGYMWIFPMGKTKGNVGVFLTEKALQDTGMTMEEVMWWWRDNTKLGQERLGKAEIIGKLKGWRLPTGKHQPIHSAGVIAVGDAGNMIEPLYGGGYPHAVIAGICAAKIAGEAAAAKDFSKDFLAKYETYIAEQLGGGYAIQELLRKQVFGKGKDIEELIDFSKENFSNERLSGGDAMARFLKEKRGFTGQTKSAYSK
jgi:geranylgeranyl reductase family protein